MTDPLVLVLFLATWGGILWIFRRLADAIRDGNVRSSLQTTEQAADDVSALPGALSGGEDLARLAAELQQTADLLDNALTRRTERLNELMAEADRKIEALHSATLAAAVAPVASVAAVVPVPPVAVPAAFSTPVEIPALHTPSAPSALSEPTYPSAPLSAPDLGRALAAGERATIEEVRRLTAEGHDPDTIARVTNRGRDEVRLLIQRD